MKENGGNYPNNHNQNQNNTSFRMEEPPPDPEDFGTKEEELKNKELLKHLYEQQKHRREVDERIKREEKLKKELEEEQRVKELYAKKSYFERRNASAKYRSMANNERIKQMLSKVDEYMKKIMNLDSIEKIKEQAQKELEDEIAQEKKRKRKITKKEIEKISELNDKNKRLRNENKKKIEERKMNEKIKAEKLKKAEEANKRAQKILQNGYKLPKAGDANHEDKNINLRSGGLGIFKEEEIKGTNLAPNAINNNDNNTNKIKRPNSSIKLGNKNTLNKVNKEEEINPEEKLKQILKKDPNNLKELLKFQKKYKYIEIGPYIHKAKMNQIKLNKNKHKHNKKIININDENINDINSEDSLENKEPEENKELEEHKVEGNQIMFQEEVIGEGDNLANTGEIPNEEDNNDEINENNEEEVDENKKKKKKKKSKSKSKGKKKKKTKKSNNIKNNYLEACKYNNDECIKNILLTTETDEKIYQKVNERDKYNRNGLMYLLIHNNTNMIKLSLLSGVKLDDTKDIYGRNLIHYCCTNNVNKSILDIICHCIEFKRFGDLCTYVNKCLPITKRSNDDMYSSDFQEECENRINDFDNLMGIKIDENEITLDKVNNNKEKDEIVNIKKMVNTPDHDGNYPMHYLAKNNDMDKMEILIYYHANLDVLDNQGNKPINLTSNKVIQQFLLKNEENSKSKKNSNNANNNGINNTKNGKDQLNTSNISLMNINVSSLNIETVQYYSSEKINSFFLGVENNSLLMLSVINQNYSLFKYLTTEKNAKVDYINGNGWSILFFIVQKGLWNYFSFLFDLKNPEQCLTPELIYNSLEQRNYTKLELMENNGTLTYLGQAIKILDTLSNKNENILSICIDEYNDIYLLKIFLILYDTYIKYFAMKEEKNIEFQRQYGKYDESSFLNIIFNRQYGKNKETILIKYTKKKDINTIKYLLDELCREKHLLNLDIYKGDYNNQNILHHAVLVKSKKIIQYLVKYDCDNNLLKTNKDRKGKTPIDIDKTKTFEIDFMTVYDAAKKNDVNLLNKLINELKYYTINEQTYLYKNTPLHYAVKYKAPRAIIFLLKNGADTNKKNSNGFTPMDTLEKVKFPDNKWIKMAKKLFSGKIKEYAELDKLEVDKYLDDSKIDGNNDIILNQKNNKNKNGDKDSKISFGKMFITNMRLINLMSKIKEFIDNNNSSSNNNKIEIKKIFEKSDKNKIGFLSCKEVRNILTGLNIPDMIEEDIDYIIISLDIEKNGQLAYKGFVSLLE